MGFAGIISNEETVSNDQFSRLKPKGFPSSLSDSDVSVKTHTCFVCSFAGGGRGGGVIL